MEEHEAFQLLTLASARDNRTVSQAVAKVWAGDLHDVPLVAAVEALTVHYRERPDTWLLPGHVIAGVRKLQAERRRNNRIESQLQRMALPPANVTLDRAKFDAETEAAIEAARRERAET